MTSLWQSRAPVMPADEFIDHETRDIVVAGAGMTGLATAVMMARAGLTVTVIDAGDLGGVTTGASTAKISLLQGTRLSRIDDTMYPSVVSAYVAGQRSAADWILGVLDDAGVPFQRRSAFTYATTEDGALAVLREHEVASRHGLDVRSATDIGLPFATTAAVELPDQLQVDPLEVAAALIAELRGLGGRVVSHTRLLGARASAPVLVRTDRGELHAGRLVLATGTPTLDRGLYFAKVSAHRSYSLAARVPEAPPPGMYLSAESPARSVRGAGELLIVGGNGHPVGRRSSTADARDELSAWTRRYWPGAEIGWQWSAQDYTAPHHVPYVGALPRGRGRILLATGYEKWGMTGAVSAALTLTADVVGDHDEWMRVLRRRITMPRAIAEGLGANLAVGAWYMRGWTSAMVRRLPDSPPSEGAGTVGRRGLAPAAVSTVDGVTCALSGVCPHLGAVVTWNDAERSWDCPAHGSRFAPDGSVIEGPATRPMVRSRALERH